MTIFFRLLELDDKGAALYQAIQQLAPGKPSYSTFVVEAESFQQVPGSPFAYWVSEKVRESFQHLESFEQNGFTASIGTSTKNDFRYVRNIWEVPPILISQDRNMTLTGKRYVCFAKGGAHSLFYSGISLVLDWLDNGCQLKADISEYRGSRGWGYQWTAAINGHSYYFHAGLTYSRRTTSRLSVRVMPQGCIFADKGPAIFAADDNHLELFALLALVNSSAFQLLVEVQLAAADAAARSYEVGLIQQTPVPERTPETTASLATFARRAWSLKRRLDTVTQTSHAFILPALLQVSGSSLSERATTWIEKVIAVETEITQIQTQIDALVFNLYGIAEVDRLSVNSEQIAVEESEPDEEEEGASAADLPTLTRELLAYVLSAAFGRFDVRLATGEKLQPPEPEPFDPLPVCSPGMLVDENG